MTDTLLKRPQLATKIAAYLALWNGAEHLIAGILERAFGPRYPHAYLILGPVQSINTRMDIVEGLLKHMHGETAWMKDALDVMPALREAATYRNKLAHGLYIESESQESVTIAGNIFDTRRKFRQETITDAGVLAEYRKLEDAVLRLTRALTRV